MVSSTTTFSEEELALIEPQESMMYEWGNEFFSRRNFRYQFANARNIGLHDTHVQEGPKTYIDPDAHEMPHGPSGMGETGGSGIQLFEQEGGEHPTYRFTQGFTTLTENIERGEGNLNENRRKVAETFDFLADSMWFRGIEDRNGNQVRPGMFDWLKSNITDNRTFDLSQSQYSGDTGSYVANNTQENLIKRDAYQTLSGRTNETGVWSMVLGRQNALGMLNARAPSDGGTDPRDTYWNRLNADPAGNDNYTGNNVGIQRQMLIPDELKFFETPPGYDDITIDLTNVLGENELIVLPDMSEVRENYWRLRQMPSPRMFDPIQKEGGQTRVDYVWRYSHSFLPDTNYNTAEDALHLTNVDQFFV